MKQRARAIIIENGKVLLIHRVKNGHEYWVFPGGGIDDEDKTIEDGLKRECMEELGVKVEIGELFFEQPSLAPTELGQMEFFYFCKIIDGVVGTGTGPEWTDRDVEKYGTYKLEWFSVEDIKDKTVYPIDLRDKLVK